MNLLDLVHRQAVPSPWAEGEKIPWDEPGFSQRMLREHLSQQHDAASRRCETIDRHVSWIHSQSLSGRPTSILDLGCGPGLYTSRLARLGHRCVGLDFSPASIAYAREQAAKERLECTYRQEDIRVADYGAGHGLVMLIFGEFNVFRPAEAHAILRKAYRALAPEGLLLLEPHTFSAMRKMGEQPRSWYAAESGLFSARPHLCLSESFWDAESRVAIERYYVIDAQSGEVARHATSVQAYSAEEYRSLLDEGGFGEAESHPSLSGIAEKGQDDLFAIVARKRNEEMPSFIP